MTDDEIEAELVKQAANPSHATADDDAAIEAALVAEDRQAQAAATGEQRARFATTATTPSARAREILDSRRPGAIGALGYGLARGGTLGAVDRLVGLGTKIGDAAAATDQIPADPDAYQKGRGEYLAGERRASVAHPGAYVAGQLAGGLVPGIATSGLGAGALTRFIPAVAGGAAAGALNTTQDALVPMLKGGGEGALLGAATEGVAGSLGRNLFRKSPTRQENAVIRDVMQSEAGRATPTTGRKLALDFEDVRDVLRNDRGLSDAMSEPAAKARPIVQDRLQIARAGQAERYADLEKNLKSPLTVTSLLQRIVDAENDLPAKDLPLVKPALLKLRDSIREDFAPRWAGTATWQGQRTPITTAQLREWVSSAQGVAERAMGGINGTNAYEVPHRVAQIANGILESRLDEAAGNGAAATVAAVRESDRKVAALLGIDRALKDRGLKETMQAVGLQRSLEQSRQQEANAAGAALMASGHPGPAAAVVASNPAKRALFAGSRFVNDQLLAPVQRSAANGSQLAQTARLAGEQAAPQSAARAMMANATSAPYRPVLARTDYRTSTATGDDNTKLAQLVWLAQRHVSPESFESARSQLGVPPGIAGNVWRLYSSAPAAAPALGPSQ